MLGLLFLVVMITAGCKDVIQQPLVGRYEVEGDDRVEAIVGVWFAEGSFGTMLLDISLDTGVRGYKISLIEDSEKYYGEAVGAYYKDKIIFSINLRKLSIQSSEGTENLFDINKQSYILIGAYFINDSLYVIPANMRCFYKSMDKYFSVSGKLSGSCNSDNGASRNICGLLFSSSSVLALDETREFMEDILQRFHIIFPQEDAVVFDKLL